MRAGSVVEVLLQITTASTTKSTATSPATACGTQPAALRAQLGEGVRAGNGQQSSLATCAGIVTEMACAAGGAKSRAMENQSLDDDCHCSDDDAARVR